MQSAAVICRNITKSFHTESAEVMALRGVDLDVKPGEMLLLVGPSGCGKTTLISVIAGVLASDSGQCAVYGADYSLMSSNAMLDFRARNIGFIFQSLNLLPSLTVVENVAVPLLVGGMARPLAMQQARAMLNEVGIGERADEKPSQLSGGQQQRIAIARALVHEPRLLLCDEPTSALDHDTGIKIMELMKSLNRRHGTTVIVVTHDNRIFPYADRIAYMDDGHITRLVNYRPDLQPAGQPAMMEPL